MAYRNFKEIDINEKLGLMSERQKLFANKLEVTPSNLLTQILTATSQFRQENEKAISEMVIFPILLDIQKRNSDFITIYSGESLDADKKKGLNGECDFIIAQNKQAIGINLPIITLVEAKGTEKIIKQGIPQCVAQMQGAKIYNEKHKLPLDIIYGCVTSGDEWIFLKLEKQTIAIDTQKYYLSALPEILGVFQQIIDYYKIILI